MRTFLMLMSLAWFVTDTLPAQPPGSGSAASEPNAALKYWQAYASMSRALNAETRRKVDSYADTPIDEAARRAVSQCEHAIELVHQAAKSPRCEWEVDLELGPASTIEHYEPVRALARLMCLTARRHFEQGLPSTGVQSCHALFALGHHTGTDDLVVCRLNQCAIETLAIVTLARYLPSLNEDELLALRQQIAELPDLRESRHASEDLAQAAAALKTRRQLLLAAIAVQQHGAEAVGQFKDPHGDGPFQYRRLGSGFQLQSALSPHVQVTVGEQPKE